MSRASRFAAVLGTMHAAHNLADHVLQTDAQALGKVNSWSAMAGHVGSYHIAQVAALAVADRALGLGLRPSRLVLAVAVSVGTHALLDRRWPVKRTLELTGSPRFAASSTMPRARPSVVGYGDDQEWVDVPLPLHGPYLADQALHHVCLWVAALIAAGGSA